MSTCAIITGEPNELVAPIRDRMQSSCPGRSWAKWLGEEPAERDELLSLLKPCEAARVRTYPIGTRVNSVRNDEPSLLEAVG